jgi:pyruvate kinase
MLSAETASGQFPVEAVATMDRILRLTEGYSWKHRYFGKVSELAKDEQLRVGSAVSRAASLLSGDLDVRAVVVPTRSGATARVVSAERPAAPVVAIASDERVCRKLALNWGVTAVLFDGERSDEAMIAHGIRRGRELGCIERGDVVVATAGVNRRTGSTNLIRVVTAEE